MVPHLAMLGRLPLTYGCGRRKMRGVVCHEGPRALPLSLMPSSFPNLHGPRLRGGANLKGLMNRCAWPSSGQGRIEFLDLPAVDARSFIPCLRLVVIPLLLLLRNFVFVSEHSGELTKRYSEFCTRMVEVRSFHALTTCSASMRAGDLMLERNLCCGELNCEALPYVLLSDNPCLVVPMQLTPTVTGYGGFLRHQTFEGKIMEPPFLGLQRYVSMFLSLGDKRDILDTDIAMKDIPWEAHAFWFTCRAH
ncbi:hypothetical protein VNO77_19397 [Canavalia gladiata]|uniref:Uncharacterized protein n=1 Tax=Canavalia gladiata TaxID=3824 RepID=A0AAN9QLC4_CANGL